MKIEWEYDLAEKTFCEQLKLMGWQWPEDDTGVPYLTEGESFREVLLKSPLASALRKLNLHDGKPWLDDTPIARAIRDLEKGCRPPADGDQSVGDGAVSQSGPSPKSCRIGTRVVRRPNASLISKTGRTTTSS